MLFAWPRELNTIRQISALLRLFWKTEAEIFGDSRTGTCCSSNVDDLTGPDDIANSFAAKYQDLYTILCLMPTNLSACSFLERNI